MDRRELLKSTVAGVFALWASPRTLAAQTPAGIRRLTDKLAVLDGGGSNVLAFSTGDGLVLVDGGAPKSGDQVMASTEDHSRGRKSTNALQHPLPHRPDRQQRNVRGGGSKNHRA